MTEERLTSILTEFVQPIASNAAPRLRHRVLTPRRLGLAGATAVVALISTAVLLPRPASASERLRKMQAAIRNAATMTATMTVFDARPESGHPFVMIRYRDRMWRTDVQPGLTKEAHIVERDGSVYLYLPQLNLVTKAPPGSEALSGELSAVDFAKHQIDEGMTDQPRTVTVEPTRIVAGRRVYNLVLDRLADKYHAVIQVDAASDLPIQSESTVVQEAGRYKGMTQRVVVGYRFNEPIANDVFDPEQFGAPVHDLVSERAALEEKWADSKTASANERIVHAWRDAEGNILIAFSEPKPNRFWSLESATSQNGPVYAISKKMGLVGTSVWAPPGTLLEVAALAPLEPGAGSETPIQVTFKETDGPRRLAFELPPPAREDGSAAMTALGLDEQLLQWRVGEDVARAEWYEAKQRYEDELRWRWAAYHDQEKVLPRGARMLYAPPIAECLRRMGRAKEGEEALAKYGEPKFSW